MKPFLLLLVFTGSLVAKPQPPYSLRLEKDNIQKISIHTEIDTLLVFQKPIDSVLGNGLTSNLEAQQGVLYQLGKANPKTIVLRHLDGRSKVLMTVMIADDAFVFKLEPGDSPASVVYLKKHHAHQAAKKIKATEAVVKSRFVSKQRIEQLFRLAKQAALLKPRIPQEYKGYSSKIVSFQNSKDGLPTSVSRIVRFDDDKALLFFGSIRNTTSNAVRMSDCLGMLNIGKARLLLPASLRASKPVIAPNETITFEGIILNTSEESPISLENTFRLHLTQNKRP